MYSFGQRRRSSNDYNGKPVNERIISSTSFSSDPQAPSETTYYEQQQQQQQNEPPAEKPHETAKHAKTSRVIEGKKRHEKSHREGSWRLVNTTGLPHASTMAPSLPPLSLHGYGRFTYTRSLDAVVAEEIRLMLPQRLQLLDSWELVYSTEQHGISLTTLYANCTVHDKTRRPGFVLVIQTNKNEIFGGFSNEPFHLSSSYYGNGECFLFKCSHKANVSGEKSPESSLGFRGFPYSGLNEYMVLSSHDFLSMGGGSSGHYGVWIDSNFDKGLTATCESYGNEPLTSDGRTKFSILNLEVWQIG